LHLILQISVLKNSVRDAKSVAAAELQDELFFIKVIITMLPITLGNTPASFPMCASKSPKTIADCFAEHH